MSKFSVIAWFEKFTHGRLKTSEMVYENTLFEFKGNWRPYQKRVLQEISHHVVDDRLHIVAAPGAGKTVLGIELVGRLGGNALVLTPRVAIRDQWISTFENLFIPFGQISISDNPETLANLNFLTYQSLSSLIGGSNNSLNPKKENFLNQLSDAGIRTMVLDEAHHLTRSWGDSVEVILKEQPNIKLISLTATPPLDYDKKEWDQFVRICGELDAEISVPELIKEDNLCPHQDFIFFNLPTQKECHEIEIEREKIRGFVNDLMMNGVVSDLLLLANKNIEDLSGSHDFDPKFLVASRVLSDRLKISNRSSLGVVSEINRYPETYQLSIFSALEIFFQTLIFEHQELINEDTLTASLSKIHNELSQLNLISNRSVTIINPKSICDRLIFSSSKIDSIASIVNFECGVLRHNLRLLVLCDRIHDELLESKKPNENLLGAIPIFFTLNPVFDFFDLQLTVLTGRVIILPKFIFKKHFSEIAMMAGIKINDVESDLLDRKYRQHYLRIEITNDETRSQTVQRVTELFNRGIIKGLIGTAGLLGEGWNSPAVNCLILASYVGSYMLTNQMRGRALRKDPKNLEKSANIWHLATVDNDSSDCNVDLIQLRRRFEGFVGLHRDKDRIESGMHRITENINLTDRNNLSVLNANTLALAKQRSLLSKRWQHALGEQTQSILSERLELDQLSRKKRVFIGWCARGHFHRKLLLGIKNTTFSLTLGAEYSMLRLIFGCVRSTMMEANLVEKASNLKIEKDPDNDQAIIIKGGLKQERSKLSNAMSEIFMPHNQTRYLIENKVGKFHLGYFGVPSSMGINRDLALSFYRRWDRSICSAELIYTKSIEGRQHLLRAQLNDRSNLSSSRLWH
jgi:superfamily II DNA or RNA helicase